MPEYFKGNMSSTITNNEKILRTIFYGDGCYCVTFHCIITYVPVSWQLCVILLYSHPVVNKEWPSRDDTRWKRSRTPDHLVYKRQDVPTGAPTGPPSDDNCCVNGTKGEKGTQG